MGQHRSANRGGNCSFKLRRYMELQIVQLKVCHRRYFTKSSRTWVCAYLITSKILQELSFGTCLCNVLCQGFSAIAGLPSAHVLCLVAFLLGGYLGTFCLPNKLFWWLQLVLSCCLYCLDLCNTGKFAELLWAAKGTSIYFYLSLSTHMFIKLQGSTRKFLCMSVSDRSIRGGQSMQHMALCCH